MLKSNYLNLFFVCSSNKIDFLKVLLKNNLTLNLYLDFVKKQIFQSR